MENSKYFRGKAPWDMACDLVATGRMLKKKRLEHGFSQELLSELFEQADYPASRQAISMWERGERMPTIHHLIFLKELYECSFDELVVSYRSSKEQM